MKDFEPTFNSIEELLRIIDISHLPQESKTKFENCCKMYYNVYSKHTWDIGRSKSTTAFVELTTNKQVTQKFYPIPANAQSEVNEILDELLKNGVIREARLDEESQFLNCLLITKRKNGKLRILLDSRLVNIHSKTIQAQFSTNLKS